MGFATCIRSARRTPKRIERKNPMNVTSRVATRFGRIIFDCVEIMWTI